MKSRLVVTVLIAAIFFSTCKKETNDDQQLLNERGFGVIPATEEQLDSIPIVDTARLFAGKRLLLPPAFELDMPPIKSQGGEGSCAAFASGYALRSYHWHRDTRLPYTNSGILDENAVFSPEYIYNTAKSSGTCKDAGMYTHSALVLLRNEGVATWASMPYSASNGCTTLPNAAQQSNAASHKIKNFERLTDLSTDYMKRFIEEEQPIIFSAKVDNGFWIAGDFVWSSRHGQDEGNHAMVICGWDDSKNAWKVMNSWGTGWGFAGFGWIDYEYFKSIVRGRPGYYEMYVIETDDALSGSIPTVTTALVTSITTTSAQSGGTISNDGGNPITASGICYATTHNPTIANNVISSTATSGNFTSSLTGLIPGTTYYVRAYAVNSTGTGYGVEVNFRTTDAPNNSCNGITSITDADGNFYDVVAIGTQCWMRQNLKVSAAVPIVTDSIQWKNLTTPAWCFYDNDLNNGLTYGKLYNWYAAKSGNLCPAGWHIPTQLEWQTLVNYLGGDSVAGGKLKSISLWGSPNTGATNSSGFTALPGGHRNSNQGAFSLIGSWGYYWSSTEENATSDWAWNFQLRNTDSIARPILNYKPNGFSCRCVKD